MCLCVHTTLKMHRPSRIPQTFQSTLAIAMSRADLHAWNRTWHSWWYTASAAIKSQMHWILIFTHSLMLTTVFLHWLPTMQSCWISTLRVCDLRLGMASISSDSASLFHLAMVEGLMYFFLQATWIGIGNVLSPSFAQSPSSISLLFPALCLGLSCA